MDNNNNIRYIAENDWKERFIVILLSYTNHLSRAREEERETPQEHFLVWKEGKQSYPINFW
jgi:deoxyribodipyrimidine photolyase